MDDTLKIEQMNKELQLCKSGDLSSTKDLLQYMKESSIYLNEKLQK